MLCYAMLCSDGELSIIISERRWGPRLPERPEHRKSSIWLATPELPRVEAYKPYAMLCYAMLCYAMLCYAMFGWLDFCNNRRVTLEAQEALQSAQDAENRQFG